MSYKQCKHTIAARFIERCKTQEPSWYPTVDVREKFEAKLAKEMEEVSEEFHLSYERGGMTSLEVVFALARGLNLDDVETAYVLFGARF